MAMTNEAFEAMVKRLEPAARANPGLYRLRVASFAALGYLYLVATVVLLIAILVLGVIAVVRLQAAAIKFLIIYVPFVFLVLRAMWVDFHPPTGIAITERTTPQLFERIERLRKALGAPRFHRVVIDDHFNAAVVQVPLLGLFGWHRNYLVIGLPLMKALTPAQLDAVIAHELGHLAGGHARFSNWLYRLRLAWAQLLGELQRRRSRGAFLFRGFFDWYVPRFEAYSFPLARENEYAADAASARLASAPAAAQALTAVSVAGSYLAERYWPAILSRASVEPQPSLAPFADLGPGLAVDIAGADGQRWLADALSHTTGFDNTHPCLADRLRALGEAPAIAPPAAGESADVLLGDARGSIVERLDRRWQDQIVHDWRRRYDEAETARERLAFLSTAASVRELDAAEAVERARLEYGVGAGADAAIAQLRAIVEKHPDDAHAHYFFGSYLLGSNDAGGIAHLETAMRLEPGVTLVCARTLRDYFASRGDAAQAEQWNARGRAAAELDEAVRYERGTLHARDTLLPHGLGANAVATLRDALTSLGVRKAWLAQKKLEFSGDRPIYVLGYSILKRFQSHDAQRTRDVQRRILEDPALPGDTFVFCVDGPNAPFGDGSRFPTRRSCPRPERAEPSRGSGVGVAMVSVPRNRNATRGTPWWAWLAGALAIVGAIGIGLYLARTGPPAVSEMPGTSKVVPAPATPPVSSIQHPIDQAAVAGDGAPLPALDASDAAVLAALGALTGEGLTALLNPEHVIQRIVATIDSLPRQKIAADALPVRGASGTFAAKREAGGDAIDARNYARYDMYAAIAKSMDAQKVVAWYVHYYPLFQQSYRELGYPDGYFNDRLVAVIDHLLATPDLPQPPALTQPNVMYEYADPALESRSAGQKLLLRSGPENEAAIKAKLREIRAVLTSGKIPPADAAPAPNALAPSEPAYLGGG